MTDATRFDLLFEPVRIGPVTAPNRFFAAPHATGHGWTQPAGAIALRAMKAEGGWGTVAVQMTEISPDSDMANHPMERLWDDGDIARHQVQAEAIHAHGSLAAIELAHGGMRARNLTTGMPVIGPSALPVLRPEVPLQARRMDLCDIRNFRNAHKAAARRARQAGYDILYVYAAHDLSLLSHFLSARTNQRGDQYGGSFDNRIRLLRDVLEDTLEVAQGECAVALRFSVDEPDKPGGLRADGEGRDVVEALADLPDLWDVNLAGWPADSQTARFSQEGFQLEYTDFVKSVTSKPVVGVGRFTSPDTMVSVIAKGRLDLIGGARPSIADPFLPAKIRDGRIDDIRECIGCNICISFDSYGLPVRCTQNPTISEEFRSGWHPETPAVSQSRRSHLVVGSGPAGLECATTLLRAGQHVTIAEARDVAGGRVSRECRLPGLSTWARVRDHRLIQLDRSGDAAIYLQSPLDAAGIAEFGADTVTIATGARWRRDGVGSSSLAPLDPGDLPRMTPDDLMDDNVALPDNSRVVVYDDDHFYMAGAVAEKLVGDGFFVSFATPLPTIAAWTEMTLEQGRIIRRLNEIGVQLYPNTILGERGVFSDTLTGAEISLAADAVVCVGARSAQDELVDALRKTDGVAELYVAGDCLVPGTIQAAVLSGHRVARSILAGKDGSEVPRREQMPRQQ